MALRALSFGYRRSRRSALRRVQPWAATGGGQEGVTEGGSCFATTDLLDSGLDHQILSVLIHEHMEEESARTHPPCEGVTTGHSHDEPQAMARAGRDVAECGKLNHMSRCRHDRIWKVVTQYMPGDYTTETAPISARPPCI